MKTLLFLLDRYPAFGGIETVTTVLANNLSLHYRIIICSVCGEEGHEILSRLNPAVTVRILPQGKRKEVVAALDSLITHEHVDVVIYQDSYARNEYIAHHLVRRGDIKLIVAEHNSPSLIRKWTTQLSSLPWWDIYHFLKITFFNLKGGLLSMVRRTSLYRICDRYVVLSEHLKPEVSEYSFIRETSKLSAISNPVTYPPLSAVPAGKKNQVLFIGRFVATKGIDRLLRIWKRVQTQSPDWSLLLLGDGPQMHDVRQQIHALGLERVELLGFRANVRDYCAESSIFCLCSDFEGFGLVIVEAMSSGTVPVCFNSFATLEDIITDGIDGYSIPPFNEDLFAERLSRLMHDDALRYSMAEAALSKTEKFNIKEITRLWINLIEQVLKTPLVS